MEQVAIVTGASSGIGRAIARRLSVKDGFRVLVHYNQNEKGAQETMHLIREGGGVCDLIHFDVKDSKEIELALDRFVSDDENQLSVLVNNAGMHKDMLLGLMSDESFDEVVRTNLYGPFYLSRWAVKKMLRQRSGCIVNISSIAGQTGNPGQANYSASKAALIAMTKTLSLEVGSRGIRVNAVSPGIIDTEMLKGIPNLDDLKKRIPLGRLGTSEEVADAVSFLCSKQASYITGHTLSVNGGLYSA